MKLILLLLCCSLFAGLAYAGQKSKKGEDMKSAEAVTYLKLYIGVRYFASGEGLMEPFDFTVSLNGVNVVTNEMFPKNDYLGEQPRVPDYVMVNLRPGTYKLHVTSKRAEKSFEHEFTITPEMTHAFAKLSYNYIPLGANMAGYTPPFEFELQAADFGWR